MKTFKVVVYERPYEYLIEAKSKEDAREKVIYREWAGDSFDILKVKVKEVAE